MCLPTREELTKQEFSPWGIYGEVEDVKSTQEPRYCVLRDIKDGLTSLLFPGLGKTESQYTANGQLSSSENFKSFDGRRERYNLSSPSKPIPSLSYSGSWQSDFHSYLNWILAPWFQSMGRTAGDDLGLAPSC